MNLVFAVALLAGALMMLHIVADVTGRWVFNRPLPGTGEIVTSYYMVAVACLPWLWVARNDAHIKVDVVVRHLPRAVAFWLDVAVRLMLAGYLVLFTWQTAAHALRQTARGEVQQAGAFYLPVWPTRWMLPLAGGLMAAWVLLRVIDAVQRRRRG